MACSFIFSVHHVRYMTILKRWTRCSCLCQIQRTRTPSVCLCQHIYPVILAFVLLSPLLCAMILEPHLHHSHVKASDFRNPVALSKVRAWRGVIYWFEQVQLLGCDKCTDSLTLGVDRRFRGLEWRWWIWFTWKYTQERFHFITRNFTSVRKNILIGEHYLESPSEFFLIV